MTHHANKYKSTSTSAVLAPRMIVAIAVGVELWRVRASEGKSIMVRFYWKSNQSSAVLSACSNLQRTLRIAGLGLAWSKNSM